MHQKAPERTRTRERVFLYGGALFVVCTLGITPLEPVLAGTDDVAALEARVGELTRELEEAQKKLAEARLEAGETVGQASADAEGETVADVQAPSTDIKIGPVTIGGAMRVNYVYGDYDGGSSGPSRGGNGGDVELDTIRANVSLDMDQLIGKLEYRWYNGYNFLHTGWLGHQFDDGSQLEVGVTRVPFGPGPYGISQSWFFDQHYYMGLSDDMDLGVKYVARRGQWNLDLAYYFSSEGNWNGASKDSARYSYDAVKWRSGLDENGDILGAEANGYEERNQFNARAVYSFDHPAWPTDLGVSLQYGQLDGKRTDDGDTYAASIHAVSQYGNFQLAAQLTRSYIDIDDDNALGTDELIPFGAYDFAWPVATDVWIPAVSLSYRYDTPALGWLDYVRPYLEYSNIVKENDDFNDSELVTAGAAWANGGWYIYTELAYSNGNYFVGDEGDDYSNIFDGVGDFGANGNDSWNARFNINFGYYF
ncbi:MAG: hypothetical protein PVG29_04650 [Gammaproteobacteria bacterium]|jgi:hypothetical protein